MGVTKDGWHQLRACGIRTVVDLRQPDERAHDARPGWLTTIDVDLDGLENQQFWKNYWDNGLVGTGLYFLPHLRAMPKRSAAVLHTLAYAPRGGVLFHCMGGRDRTGLVAMLLLAAANVVRDEIVDDYLETVRLGDVRAASANRENAEPRIEEFCATHGTTTAGAFRDALAGLDLHAFFTAAELDVDTIALLLTWRGTLPQQPSR